MVFYVVFVIALTLAGTQSQSPVISPSPTVNVTEGDNLTVTCTYNATQTIDTFVRLLRTTTGVLWEIIFSNNCISFSANKHLSTCNMSHVYVYTLQLVLTSNLYSHGDTITCEVLTTNSEIGSDTLVFTTVPIKTVDLIQPNSSEVSVIEGKPLVLICTSNGRPRPTIEWYKQKDMESEVSILGGNTTQTSENGTESELQFVPNRTDNNYRMYCKAYNVEQQVPAISLHKPMLNILYPPSIHIIEYIKIEEGRTLNVTCSIVEGNPENANFCWSHGQAYITSSATLEINNIARDHSGIYECVVYNVLQPTFGGVENGSESESFHLDVLYKSSVIEFSARTDGHTYTNITIDELDSINVYCSVDSNPNSNIDINRNGHQIVRHTNVDYINHFVESAACDEAGIYTCTGYNPHIQDQRRDTADIMVNVRCSPRASKSIDAIKAIALNDTVHLTVTFVAYPVPRDEDYIWRKQLLHTSWVQLNTTDRITISTSHLQTSLFIINVNQHDYGNYSLTVSNNVANDYYQVFGVLPYVLADQSMEQSNTNVVGIVVGSVVGCIVFLASGIVIGICITRRKQQPDVCCLIKKVKQKEDNHVYYNTTQTDSLTEVTTEETGTNGPIIEETVFTNAYEQMVSPNPDENVYTELKYDDHDDTDTEHVEPAEPAKIYINLKIQDTSS